MAAGLTMAAFQAQAAEFEWQYFSVAPPLHPYAQILTKHFDAIEERTNGDLDINLVYFGETPYKGAEAEKLMRDGLVEMTEWLLGYSTSTYPILSGPELPFLAPSRTDATEMIKAMDGAWASEDVAAALDDILKRHDAVKLSRFYWAPQNHWLTKPIDGPDGFKGLKIREFSAEGVDFTEAIGATPVSMTAPDVYSALQRGTLDGVVTASTSMTGLKWGEVLKAGYITNFKLTISLILVSQEAYDRLPPEYQTILKEEVDAATSEILDYMASGEEEMHELLKSEYGFTITYASEEDYNTLREIAKEAVWPNWIERVGADRGKPVVNGVLEALGAKERM
ncbi:TRAP transporter substrate-binding protein [Acuticoccus mangrovi]|uniref:TRAP transporter substrate-binding protein DctP n=1 Tax=Acuticoccus mangrovi TaxID=2796142 RepID=A0A934IK20_9HYPH|nr:TRAP transporter substrate-binding protein DctP [Acuticoccus mangrovi]MBJ3778114.1 TRAP transporter substrate-binding protein DctP [Acuticoccus mangrovi]